MAMSCPGPTVRVSLAREVVRVRIGRCPSRPWQCRRNPLGGLASVMVLLSFPSQLSLSFKFRVLLFKLLVLTVLDLKRNNFNLDIEVLAELGLGRVEVLMNVLWMPAVPGRAAKT